MTDNHLSNLRFDAMALHDSVQAGIRDAGFEFCTPIQARTLPIALEPRDVAGQAQTGTGKTAGFLIATFQKLLASTPDPEQKKQPRAFMLAPTRELAVQIANDAELLGKHTGYKIGLAFGGTDYEKQRRILEDGVDILIGTPGRIIDYFKQGVFKLDQVEVAVLDEADRMFDLGFIKDIRYLLRRMPPPTERLGMLFSATLSYRVTELAYEHMNHPHPVEIEPDQVTTDRVAQRCDMVANDEKIALLIGLMNRLEEARVIVFINTKREADRVWGFLEGNGHHAAILSGDVPQKKRLSLLKRFSSGEVSVLVATDVAARGIDIPGVGHVYNYDLPNVPENYVHRIGRTARAGRDGRAIAFCAADEVAELKAIEKVLGMRVEIAGGRAWEGFGDAPKAKKGRRSRRRSFSRRPERMAA